MDIKKTIIDNKKIIHDFHQTAVVFCQWAEGEPGILQTEYCLAKKYIAKLYLGGLELPDFKIIEKQQSIITEKTSDNVFKRFASLPFQYYWEIYTPITDSPDEPVVGDLCDDLRDIYVDIKNGLVTWDTGNNKDAVVHWKSTFSCHWGDHAVRALRALHLYEIKK